jgi:hypothetical protein
MYRGLIDNLAFVYGFLYKGRGRLDAEEMRMIADGAHTITKKAPVVLGGRGEESADDKADLAAARNMDKQIEEATIFLTNLEIV